MHFINHVQLLGRAGSDAATELLSDGSRIARLRLYQSPGQRSAAADPTCFQLVAWNGVAEQLHARVHRGDRLLVQGKLVNRQGRHGDAEFVRTEVHVTHFAVLASRKQGATTHCDNRLV